MVDFLAGVTVLMLGMPVLSGLKGCYWGRGFRGLPGKGRKLDGFLEVGIACLLLLSKFNF